MSFFGALRLICYLLKSVSGGNAALARIPCYDTPNAISLIQVFVQITWVLMINFSDQVVFVIALNFYATFLHFWIKITDGNTPSIFCLA